MITKARLVFEDPTAASHYRPGYVNAKCERRRTARPHAPKPKKQAAKGRLQLVFESAAGLPRRQQQKIAEVVEALVAQHGNGQSKPA